MLPKGAISSLEELEEIDRRAKAGEKIKLYWASTGPLTLREGYARGQGVWPSGSDYIISALPFGLSCQVACRKNQLFLVSNVLFTNYWYAYAWAQKINKKEAA